MAPSDRVTFVSAVNSREILHKNLLASPVFQSPRAHQLIVQEGFPSAARAYNDAIDRSENDVLILVHQDVILPGKWLADLGEALTHLSQSDPQWGVLGCYGETKSREDKGYVYSPDMGTIGKPLAAPELVQTLDEIVLILRKSSGLRFDETLPHFHFYGADICLAAAQRNMKCYSIPAFCIHNTDHYLALPEEFYVCYRHIKRRWREFLPIETSCMTISKFDLPLYRKRLLEFYDTRIKRKPPIRTRVPSGADLLSSVEQSLQHVTHLGPFVAEPAEQ